MSRPASATYRHLDKNGNVLQSGDVLITETEHGYTYTLPASIVVHEDERVEYTTEWFGA